MYSPKQGIKFAVLRLNLANFSVIVRILLDYYWVIGYIPS